MADAATILHADLDAFYASVEQLLDPRLAGRPVAVGGSVVLAASYEAREYGVRAGMAGWQARRLCRSLVFVGGHFRAYQRLGQAVMTILESFTPRVERVSIDEAFLDVAGARRLFGDPADIARLVRRRVRDEVGLAISVGVARTKHLAKIASQVAKPDGLVVVDPEAEPTFLDPLPVGLVWGVGPATRARLADHGIHTIGDLARASDSRLGALLGAGAGTRLAALAANEDPRPVDRGRSARSVGSQAALGRVRPAPDLCRAVLGQLADRVARRLRAADCGGRTVTVRVRFPAMRSVTRSLTLDVAVASTLTLVEVAEELVASALADNPGESEVTLLAISVSNLAPQAGLQLELPGTCPIPSDAGGEPDRRAEARRAGSATGSTRWAVDRAMDEVRERFGRRAIGYTSIALSGQRSVPDEFRELAQRELPRGADAQGGRVPTRPVGRGVRQPQQGASPE